MSGPKSTNYRLERQIQQMIREDVVCTQQCKVCSDAIQASMAAIKARAAELQRQIIRLTEHAERVSVDCQKVEEFRNRMAQIEKTLQAMREQFQIEAAKQTDTPTVTPVSLRAKQEKLSALRGIQSELGQISRMAESEIAFAEKMVRERNARIEQSIADDLKGVSFFISEEQPRPSATNEAARVEHEKQTLYAALQQLIGEGLTAEVHRHVKQAMLELSRITQASYLHTFKAITFERIRQEVAESRTLMAKQHEEYSRQFSRYAALTELLGISRKAFDQSPAGILKLKEEADELEALAAAQKERAYIAQCVDETMTEMGYKVLGNREVRKKSGKYFRNELYQFNEGSAVNITYAADGKITMEIGGLAHGDRLPDATEARQLTEDMDAFCAEFKVFETRLKEKGVLVGERIQMLPPSFEYAQIINLDDYRLEDDGIIPEITARSRDYGVSEKKILRRND